MTRTGWAVGLAERLRDEVSREHEQVRAKRLRNSHAFLYPSFSHIGAKVNVCDLCNPKSVKRVGQAGEANLDVLRNWMMGFYEERVDTSRANQGRCSVGDEAPA
jgi:hypothetical protein